MTNDYSNWTIQSFIECYSDYHKDAYGFRPRHSTADWSLLRWTEEFKHLDRVYAAAKAERLASEAAAVERFEANIDKLMAMGAADRATAIRWIIDDEGDVGYVEFEHGLPYGYILQAA